MDKNQRFSVSVVLDVKEVTTDGSAVDFFNSTVNYPNMGYDGVIGIEQAMLQVLQQLGDAGLKQAVALGHGEKMEAMGFAPRLAMFKQ